MKKKMTQQKNNQFQRNLKIKMNKNHKKFKRKKKKRKKYKRKKKNLKNYKLMKKNLKK